MKKCLLCCIVLLGGIVAHGQNYHCLQPGVKNFFTNSDGYLRGIRIDSVKTYTDSTIVYPYRTPRGTYGWPSFPFSMNITDSNGGCWLGKKVIELSDGTTIFDGLWGGSVIIKTQANVSDSWTMYNDSGSIYYTATVIGKDTQTVLSMLDSVKYMRINAFNSSGPLTSDPLDSFILVLSKNHGFAQVIDLYTFPYHKPDSAYVSKLDYFMDLPIHGSVYEINKMAFKIVNFINPNDVQMHNWSIGDTLESLRSCGTLPVPWGTETNLTIFNTITGQSVSPHSTTYTLDGTNAYTGCPSPLVSGILITTAGTRTFYDTSYSILDSAQMPEDRYNNDIYSIYYFPDTLKKCTKGPMYVKRPARVMDGLGEYYEEIVYKSGIGLISYDYQDGNPSFWKNSLIYYSLNGIRCGKYVGIGVFQLSHKIFTIKLSPNPATDRLTIKVDNNGEQYTIALNNLLGQTIRTIQTTREEEAINIRDLAAGMYIVNITHAQGGRSSHKVIIQH